MTEMLLKAQNAVGELYLEIGMTRKGLSYFQKAWSNLLRFTLSDLKSSQELLKQKGRRHLQRPLYSCSSESRLFLPGKGKGHVVFFFKQTNKQANKKKLPTSNCGGAYL